MSARAELDEEALVARYLGGESELSLARSFGVDRNTIRKRLLARGVDPRGPSEAGFTRAARMTAEERKAQATPSHIAARGRIEAEEKLARAAMTRYRNQSHARSDGEILFERWLTEAGWWVEPEFPVGRYNIDLAIVPLAIEILGGKWHGYKAAHERRTAYLLSQGWSIAFVWNTELWPITRAASSAVEDLLDDLPSKPRWTVFRGDGALIASGSDPLIRIPSANSLSTRKRRTRKDAP